jgi:hypothetical protein
MIRAEEKSQAESLDIAALCAAAQESMARSIGTKVGIYCAKSRQREQAFRQQAQQQMKAEHDRHS